MILESQDISTASGLDPDEVARALALPAMFEELGITQPVVASPLVGGPPGFAT